jgi:hypothetical protein
VGDLARVVRRAGSIPSPSDLPGSKILQLAGDDHAWKRAALLGRVVPFSAHSFLMAMTAPFVLPMNSVDFTTAGDE